MDIVGKYGVTIGDKSYDTVCVMVIGTYNCGVVSEQFLDKAGKTLLWHSFLPDFAIYLSAHIQNGILFFDIFFVNV